MLATLCKKVTGTGTIASTEYCYKWWNIMFWNLKIIEYSIIITWKLSKALSGIQSSKCCIASHGPSPTPTITIERG